MTFGAPLFFWTFAFLPLLAFLFVRNEQRRNRLLRKLVASRLMEALAGSVSPTKRRLRFILFMLGLAFLILALTRPRFGLRTEEHKVTGKDVIIAIDTSRSMLANDVSPSRIARAKFAAEDLITQLHGDRVGLVAFAGTAFLQAPLTADYSAVLDALHEIDTTIIPQGGTDIAEAIRTSVEAFGKGESENRALIIFTDGEELDEDAVAEAKKLNGSVHIFTVGVGTAEGTIIALPGAGATEYIKSPEGEIVKSRLDEPRLEAIAEASGGFYVHLNSGPAEMQQIVSQGLSTIDPSDKGVEITRRPIERYRWPLGAALVLLIFSRLPNERRKRVRAAGAAIPTAALLLLLPVSGFSKNPGVELYEKEDYGKAKETFEKQLEYLPKSDGLQFDLGTSAYKTGDLDKALEAFSKAITSSNIPLREKAEYNLGNTLFQRGALQKDEKTKLQDWKNSIQHYDEALKAQPKDADARYNRDAVQRMIDELQKKPPQSQQNKDDKKDKKDDQQDKQQQGEGGGGGGQQQEQQNQDQKGQKQQQNQQQQGQQNQQNQPQNGQQGQQSQPQQGQQGEQPKDQQGQQPKDQQGQQGQQPKDQQGQQPKDQKGQQPKEGQEPKDQHGEQPKDQPGQEPKEQQGQQAKAEQGQPKDQQAQEAKAQQAQPGDPQQQGDQPPDRKLSGQIGDAEKREDQAKQNEKEAAEEKEAAAKGEMTPSQATALLDSLKDEAHVPFGPRNHKPKDRNLRDW